MSKEKQIEERLELSDVIDYAIRDFDDYLEECHAEGNSPIDTFEECIADAVLRAGYRKQSEWISVEERLPEVGGTYLIALKEKYEWEKDWRYHVDVASFTFEWDCIFHDWDEGQGIHITHWMPLPEAPKKGGAE